MTLKEKILRAQMSQRVEELKARHAWLHGIAYNREEWDVFWHMTDNTTWAHQFGRMVGAEEVYYNSVTFTDERCYRRFIKFTCDDPKTGRQPTVPEYAGHDPHSTGRAGTHALASSVIEVAADNQSARSFFLTPGILMGPVGFEGVARDGFWLWERYGSDFVMVDGQLMWFHEQVCPDMGADYDDQNWAHDRYLDAKKEDVVVGELGGVPAHLTEPGLIHCDYTVYQPVQNTVPPPTPYETLDDDNTYSKGRNTY